MVGELPPVTADGHRYKFLRTGAHALDALVAMIRQAQKSLRLEMYIYKDDETGKTVRAALLDACERGIKVRILLDDFGCADLPRDFFAALLPLGAELRFFNPSRAMRAAFRDHRKLCVADDVSAVVGGFNVADEYCGDGIAKCWRDLGMQIDGPVVVELAGTFDRMFFAARADTRAVIVFARGSITSDPDLARPSVLTAGPGFRGSLLRRILVRDFQSAHRLSIMAAYFTPPWRMRRALRRAAKRGIVRIVLPGVSDVRTMRLAAQHLYEGMLRHGVEIFEYQPQVLHAKLVVVDDVVCVGSCNFDVRSLQLNFDFLVRIPNAELAAQARAIIAHDIGHSFAVTLPEWHASSGWWRRTVRWVAYWLATRFDPFLARRNWRALR